MVINAISRDLHTAFRRGRYVVLLQLLLEVRKLVALNHRLRVLLLQLMLQELLLPLDPELEVVHGLEV